MEEEEVMKEIVMKGSDEAVEGEEGVCVSVCGGAERGCW